jgi:hypothetical protein
LHTNIWLPLAILIKKCAALCAAYVAQALLDERVGGHVYLVVVHEELGEVAKCLRCSRFAPTLIKLSNRNWLVNAETHFRTHPDPKGMHSLDFYGVRVCTTREQRASR